MSTLCKTNINPLLSLIPLIWSETGMPNKLCNSQEKKHFNAFAHKIKSPKHLENKGIPNKKNVNMKTVSVAWWDRQQYVLLLV